MNWLTELIVGDGVAHSILLFSFVIAAGIFLGRFKIKGISLGITFVLFVGILMGHFGLRIDSDVLHFMKEFGLILFVYSIGLQVGPGFVSSFKKGGLQLNLLATGIVLIGVVVTLAFYFITDIPIQTMVGIMSGAVTNTPGLGAAQEAFQDTTGAADATIAMAYAVAYPLAVIGIIGTIIALRYFLRIKLENEEKDLRDTGDKENQSLELLTMEVKNPAVFNQTIKSIADLMPNRRFIVSRILHKADNRIEIASSKTLLNEGDKILLVTKPEDKQTVKSFIGTEDNMTSKDWATLDKQLSARRIIVSRSAVNGQSIEDLNLRSIFAVNITRVNRAGVELIADAKLKLQIGDRLTIVGSGDAIENASKVIGNKIDMLNEPHLVPIFVGIFLGVLLGSIPIVFPGVPQPIKLGLAGGPLIVAILMSIFGTKYKLVTYTTLSANLMLREIGICFFLACVGLSAGEGFIDTIVNDGGFYWIGYGFIITIVPLLFIGIIGRTIYKLNYYTLMGLMAGSMTDPPALAYANSISNNDAPAVSYASVYPLTMFLRVLCAQLLILFFL